MDTTRAENYYFKELERRKDLDSAPTFRVAVLALVAGVFSYYAQHLTLDGSRLSWLFLAASGVVIVCAALSIIWIVRLYVGFAWGYMPPPDELAAHYTALCEYGKKYGFDSGNADQAFDEYLRSRYIEAASRNMRNNNARSELLYSASFFLAITVLFTLVAGIPVVFITLEHLLVFK